MSVEFIAIGTSLGGVSALRRLFSELPDNFAVPIAVVIHRGAVSFDYLIDTLQKSTALKVQEASDKLPITRASITIAPAEYHLLVDNGHYALSLDGPVNYARPSIDVLFESVAEEYGPKAVGLILTGGGSDGVCGLQAIKQRKGSVLVESPETAEDATLPQAILDANIVTAGHSLERLAAELVEATL